MKKLLNIIVLALLMMHSSYVSGQSREYKISGLVPNVYDYGLSSNLVYSITQDDYGILWFGTLNGLNTYDKHVFDEYNASSGDIRRKINCLSPVHDSLFVGTDNGLFVIDLNTSEVTIVPCAALGQTKPRGIITKISDPHNGRLLVGTKKGIYCYDLINKVYNPLVFEKWQSNFCVNDIVFDKENDVWMIATDKGLMVYDDKDNDVKCFAVMDAIVNTILRCNGVFFVGTNKGLYKLNIRNGIYENIPLIDNKNYEITKILIVDNDLIIGTQRNGLHKLDMQTYAVTDLNHNNVSGLRLLKHQVLDLYRDNCGVVWVATTGGIGTLTLDDKSVNIYKYYLKGTKLQPVWCIEEMSDPIYFVGTDVGVWVFDKNDGSFTDLCDYYGFDSSLVPPFRVNALFFDRSRYLWAGTYGEGLHCFDIEKKKYFNVTKDFDADELVDATVYEVILGVDNTFWIASDKGLFRVNIDNVTYKSYVHDPLDVNSLPSNMITDILWDNGTLYISTDNGFSVYSPDTDEFTNYRLEESLDDDMRINTLFKINKRPDGSFYIGSYTDGVVIFDPVNKRLSIRDDKLKFKAPMLFSIIFDKNDNVWVNTNKGIIWYDKKYGIITNMSNNTGFKGSEFVINAMTQGSKGDIFCGGIEGFNVFKPEKVKVDTTLPKVIITDFITKNEFKGYRIHSGDTIVLPYTGNSFNLSFAAININNVNTVKYKYKLEGYDDEWTVCDVKKRYAEYRQLSAGTYKFMLMAANEAGQWNPEVFEFTLRIFPEWYDTVWFRVIIALVVVALLLVVIFYRREKIRQKMMHQQELAEREKMIKKLSFKSLQLQMNPHSMFNILNSIQSYMLANDTKSAIVYLSGFAKLMRRLLYASQEQLITLFEELGTVRLYLELESMRMRNRFTFSINIDDDVNTKDVDVMPLLFQPFVENAIIHGLARKEGEGLLKIEIHRVDKNKLLCVIEDNGIGRKKAEELSNASGKKHRSYGMEITKRRLEYMKTITDEDYCVNIVDLYDENGNAAGTRAEIIINSVE